MATKHLTPSKQRVLLLGHETGFEQTLTSALRAEGYEVVLSPDNGQAAEMTRALSEEVLVLDLDCFPAALSQPAAGPGAKKGRCRLLAIARSLEQMAAASEMAADAVLLKPFDLPHLASVLRNLRSGLSLRSPAGGPQPSTHGFPTEPASTMTRESTK